MDALCSRQSREKPAQIQAAIQHLFAVVSLEGSHQNDTNEAAYLEGIEYFIEHPYTDKLLKHFDHNKLKVYSDPNENWIQTLDQGLLTLDAMPMKIKRALIEALSIVIGFDNEVSQTESELLRAICSTLHCPMPPIIKSKVDT